MVILLLCLLSLPISPQLTAPLTNSTYLELTTILSTTVTQDPFSPTNPDFYRSLKKSNHNVYLLGSNNIVEVYSRSYPNSLVWNLTDYVYSGSTSPPDLLHLTVNRYESVLILTSYTSNTLSHLLYNIDQFALGVFIGTFGTTTIEVPSAVFTRNQLIYSYINRTHPNNDSIHVTNAITNATYEVPLGTKNGSIAES